MQKKTKRALSASTIASLLVTSSVVSVNVKAAATTASENPRLWGSDRYETAAKVAQTGWTSTSDYAVIASGEGYADALCAAPLAKVNNAPILLTQNGDLNANALSELKRLNVKHAFIVGGTGVVSQNVEDKVKAQVGDVQRLAGQNRYETSVKVAEKLGTASKIVLASGEGYADALSAAPVAAIEGMPILLTQSNTLSTATAEYIKANTGITKTYVIGGYASVSDAAMNLAPGAERISGSDRYATNAAVINKFASDFNFSKAYFALGNGPTGNEFADALTGSALAAKDKAPLIIVGKELSDSTKDLIKTRLTKNTTITVLGGTANIADSMVSDVITLSGAGTITPGGGSGGSSGSSSTNINTTTNLSGGTIGTSYITAGVSLSNGTVNGDLYVNADSATLSNLTVTGTLYVNPGTTGSTTLDSVTAANVVVQSGGGNSIHFKGNTKVTKLVIAAVNNNGNKVRIVIEGNIDITETEVDSQAKLEAVEGSFGSVKLQPSTANKAVELIGAFDKPVIIKGNVDIQTSSDTNIAALVVAEDANADGIKVEGNGNVTNIQIRNANVTVTIANNIVVVTIVAVDSTKVTAPISVVEKPVDQMTDVDSLSYNDITGFVSGIYTNNVAAYIAKHPGLNNYFTVNTESGINVQLNKDSLNSLSSAFDTAQSKDYAAIKAKLTKVQEQIDLHSSYVKVDGVPVKEFLGRLNYSPYITTTGSINVYEVATRILDKTLTYEIFKSNLKTRIEAMYNTSNAAPKLTISYAGFSKEITKISKDGKIIYNTSLSREDNITNLVNLGDSTPGTYTVYCGMEFFTVKVLAK